jgi:hypothetical protein
VRVSSPFGEALANAVPVRVLMDKPVVSAVNPVLQVRLAGQSATLSVAASGSGTLSYQWLKDGVQIQGATASVLSIGSVAASDSGEYKVEVRNEAGAVVSGVSRLLVLGFAAQPVGGEVELGSALELSATPFAVPAWAQGSLLYQWTRNGSTLASGTGGVLRIGAVGDGDVGGYRVSLRSSLGNASVQSAVANVSVVGGLRFMEFGPLTQVVLPGGTLRIKGAVVGRGEVKYRWLKRGEAVAGASAGELLIPSATVLDEGEYQLEATDSAGALLSPVAKTGVLRIIQQPVGGSFVAGKSLTLSVRAGGSQELTYQWLKNGAPVAGAVNATYGIGSAVLTAVTRCVWRRVV